MVPEEAAIAERKEGWSFDRLNGYGVLFCYNGEWYLVPAYCVQDYVRDIKSEYLSTAWDWMFIKKEIITSKKPFLGFKLYNI